MPILVYHTGALGDFITTIPALRYWRNQHEAEKLVLLGKSSIGEFAKNIGLIDEVLDVDSAQSAPLFSGCFSAETEKILSPFNTAILFAAPGSPIINTIRQSAIQSFYWQPPFPATKDKIHITDYHLSLFVDPGKIADHEKVPSIVPSAYAIADSYKIIPPDISPVAIHPGSGSRKKNWPFERYFLLADAVRKKGLRILWLLGPAEAGFSVPPNDTIVSNQPFALCAALLSRCRAFVGNDSGITHLAAGVGCRTIALFGPSAPQVWSPRGRDVCVIYKNSNPGLTAINVEEVFNEIRI